MNPKVANAIKIDEQTLFHNENGFISTFSNVSIFLAQNLTEDIEEIDRLK